MAVWSGAPGKLSIGGRGWFGFSQRSFLAFSAHVELERDAQ